MHPGAPLAPQVQWYERRANMPAHLQEGMHDREVVEWLQTDTNLVGCIERKATVVKARSYEEVGRRAVMNMRRCGCTDCQGRRGRAKAHRQHADLRAYARPQHDAAAEPARPSAPARTATWGCRRWRCWAPRQEWATGTFAAAFWTAMTGAS